MAIMELLNWNGSHICVYCLSEMTFSSNLESPAKEIEENENDQICAICSGIYQKCHERDFIDWLTLSIEKSGYTNKSLSLSIKIPLSARLRQRIFHLQHRKSQLSQFDLKQSIKRTIMNLLSQRQCFSFSSQDCLTVTIKFNNTEDENMIVR